MNRRILKTIATGAFAAVLSGPLLAQIPVPPVPNLSIHITNGAPPPPRRERMERRPGRDYVFVKGAYDWRDSRWEWVPGRWDRPESRGSRWIVARYVRDGGSYRYEPGHWSTQRLAEGDDYRQWHEQHHNDRNHDRRYDRDRERDERENRDHDHDHNRN
jgi:hypothetical protein